MISPATRVKVILSSRTKLTLAISAVAVTLSGLLWAWIILHNENWLLFPQANVSRRFSLASALLFVAVVSILVSVFSLIVDNRSGHRGR